MQSNHRSMEAWQDRLLLAGDEALTELHPLLDAADPEGRVAQRSRRLCAALGLLSQVAYAALGGRRASAEVGLAGAALSLLTKVDDEVIDSLAFHGGMVTDRSALRRRTAAYLAPTLASLRLGIPARDEPRCVLAADVGRRLRRLAGSPSRLAHVLETVAEGWRIQVEAVAVLSTHPAAVTPEEVDRVTRRISGAWLLMIALVGTLPADAARRLSADEERAFYDWGFHIQRADALADLGKDSKDGLVSSFAGRLAWARDPARYLEAFARGDEAALYTLVARHRVDEACLRDGADPEDLRRRLAGLGEVNGLLRWIQGFLMHRYLTHPLCRRNGRGLAFRRFRDERAAWADYVATGGTGRRRAPPRSRDPQTRSPDPRRSGVRKAAPAPAQSRRRAG